MNKLLQWWMFLCFYAVCKTVGLLASYLNRPMFPETARNFALDDKVTYNTMIRIAGSYSAFGPVFVAVMQFYGWRRVVLMSDLIDTSACSEYSAPLYNWLNGIQDIYVYWIRMSSTPSDSEITGYLQDVQSRSRSEYHLDGYLRH